jgi:hypothetical protein
LKQQCLTAIGQALHCCLVLAHEFE